MTATRQTLLAKFRHRQKRQGIVRVEVQVRREDAALVRGVAQALADPARAAATRSLIASRFATPVPAGLKALLATAPLDGIDLDRPRDPGRPVDR